MSNNIKRHFDESGEYVYATLLLPKKEYLKRRKRVKAQKESRRKNRK